MTEEEVADLSMKRDCVESSNAQLNPQISSKQLFSRNELSGTPFDGLVSISKDSYATLSLRLSSNEANVMVYTGRAFALHEPTTKIMEFQDLVYREHTLEPDSDFSPVHQIFLCFACQLYYEDFNMLCDHSLIVHSTFISSEDKSYISICQSSLILESISNSESTDQNVVPILIDIEHEIPLNNIKPLISSSQKPDEIAATVSSNTPFPNFHPVVQAFLARAYMPSPLSLVCSDPENHQTLPGASECTKCDAMLATSRNSFQMTLSHSRNSCKTLKCPKCNWHYKYQQTLETHMKEKHPETVNNCVYCAKSETHPKLARGETYSCGYKPFRCDVCNYSTTTKGNLSIHMQSDKHLNNVQELRKAGQYEIMQQTSSSTASCVSETFTTSNDTCKTSISVPSTTSNSSVFRCDVCDFESSNHISMTNHVNSEKHSQNLLLVQQATNGSQGKQLSSDIVSNSAVNDINNQYALLTSVSDTTPDPSKLFTCTVCNAFASNDLSRVHNHALHDRSQSTTQNSGIDCLALDGNNFRCQLCNYSTSLKANFTLHSQTEKHKQKMQIFNHLKEGGGSLDDILNAVNTVSTIQIFCGACAFVGKSVGQISSHVNTEQHLFNSKLHEFFANFSRSAAASSASGNAQMQYSCKLCNIKTISMTEIIAHVTTEGHSNNLKERQFLGLPLNNWSDVFKIERIVESENANENQGDNQDETIGEAYSCPLCSKVYRSRELLREHLFHNHNVSSECVDGLMAVVKPTMSVKPLSRTYPTDGNVKKQTSSAPLVINNCDSFRCHRCRAIFQIFSTFQDHLKTCVMKPCPVSGCNFLCRSNENIARHIEEIHPNAVATDLSTRYLCWKKGCSQYFSSEDILFRHFLEIHNTAGISETIASMSLPTPPVTSISNLPVSLDSLTEMQHTDASEDYLNTPRLAELHYESDQRPFKCTVCRLAFTRRCYLLIHQSSVAHPNDDSKSTQNNISVEKPYTCSICDVSYAEQSTLDIHLKSVLHQSRVLSAWQLSNAVSEPLTSIASQADMLRSSLSLEGVELPSELKQLQESLASQQQLQQLHLVQSMDLQSQQKLHANILQQQQQFLLQQQKFMSSILPIYATILPSSPTLFNCSKCNQYFATQDALMNHQATMCNVRLNGCNSPTRTSRADVSSLLKASAAEFLNNVSTSISSKIVNTDDPPAKLLKQSDQANENKLDVPTDLTDTKDSKINEHNSEDETCSISSSEPDNLNNAMAASLLHLQQSSLMNPQLMMLQNSGIAGLNLANISLLNSTGIDHSALQNFYTDMQKRPRTRISDEQLKILKDHFDLSNSPTDSEVDQIAIKTGLQGKVIKHWFRNTLFKERQKNKDSPYNFSNPPDVNNENSSHVLPIYPADLNHLTQESVYLSNNAAPQPLDNLNSTRRASRTRFSDFQLKSLQEFFERNAYPRDEDLEKLSKSLNLSPRVVVVWFQNQRQKARRNIEISQQESKQNSNGAKESISCKKCNNNFNTWDEHDEHVNDSCYDASVEYDDSCDEGKNDDNTIHEIFFTCQFCTKLLASEEEYESHEKEHLDAVLEATSSKGTQTASHPAIKQEPLNLAMNNSIGEAGMLQIAEKDKRIRTTISPAQLEVLYSSYQEDSNPSRQMLEEICAKVGLKRRVVQVWFQNTRARQRKGATRVIGMQSFHCRCPYCQIVCTSKSHLITHLHQAHLSDKTSNRIPPNVTAPLTSPVKEEPSSVESSSSINQSIHNSSVQILAHNISISPNVHSIKHTHESSNKNHLEESPELELDLSYDMSIDDESESSIEAKNSAEVEADTTASVEATVYYVSVGQGMVLNNKNTTTEHESNTKSLSTAPAATSFSPLIPQPTQINFISPTKPTLMSPNSDCDDNSSRRRYRTHLSVTQIKIFKVIFADYKTPTMSDCEVLGSQLDLPKRVVQVWFQNARSKEKKARLNQAKAMGIESLPDDDRNPPKEACELCHVNFTSQHGVREHVFLPLHIQKVKEYVSEHLGSENIDISLPIKPKKTFNLASYVKPIAPANDSAGYAPIRLAANPIDKCRDQTNINLPNRNPTPPMDLSAAAQV